MTGLGRANFWESLQRLFTPGASGRNVARTPHAGRAALLCLLAAVVIWFLLTMGEDHSATIDFRVELLNPPEGQALVEPLQESVMGQVEGTGFELLKLFFQPPVIELSARSQQVDLMADPPTLSGGVVVRSLVPRTLSLVTDERIRRRIPVVLRATFEPAPTYRFTPVDSVLFTPDSVTVEGAARVVNALRAWPTERRTFTNLLDSMETTLALADTLDGFIVPDVEAIRVHVAIAAFTEVEFDNVEVQVRGAPSDNATAPRAQNDRQRRREQTVRLTPTSVRVRYSVLVAQEPRAREAGVVAYVDFDDIRGDNANRLVVSVLLPDDLIIRDLSVTPSTVGYVTVQASQ